MESDFSALSKKGVESAKAMEAKEKAEAKADKSVEHSVLRKQKLPPTQSEIKQRAQLTKEVSKEESAYANKKQIGRIKVTTSQYYGYFGEKYPEIKKLTKPAEKDGLEEWQTYLTDMKTILASKKADATFDNYMGYLGKGLEELQKMFPQLTQGRSLSEPVPLSQVLGSEGFLESIDDEKHEIIFNHASWFQSGYWSRILSSVGKATIAVALQNEQEAQKQAAQTVAQFATRTVPQ